MAFGKQPTAAQAIQENKDAIQLFVAASGPVEFHQILRECAEQAHGRDDLVEAAINELVSAKRIARHLQEPLTEGDESYYTYDAA